jgi:Polyketide synthase dehydratase
VRLQDVPYVLNHLVNGIPTLPGAFLIMMVAKAALELRPRLKVTAFEDASFRKFVRLRGSEPTRLQLRSTVISENAEGALLRVEVTSDFVHKSGVVLQKDVVQTEISVRMAAAIERPIKSDGVNTVQGRLLHDPYVTNGSPVRLNGPFRTMKNIMVGERNRSADYKPLQPIRQGSEYEAFLPNLLVMDSLWRFGAIRTNDHNALPVYVPEACRVMKVYYDLAAPDIPTLTGHLLMTGSNPQEDDDRLVIGPVAVKDAAGSLLLAVEGGICRQMGEVRNGD